MTTRKKAQWIVRKTAFKFRKSEVAIAFGKSTGEPTTTLITTLTATQSSACN